MPSNKKPHKAYKPKYAKGQMPITIRHSNDADRTLQMIPHDELEKFRQGEADEFAVNTLSVRLNWGYVMAGEFFDNPEVRAALEAGLAAIRSVKERVNRLGKYGTTGEEFRAIGDALNYTDEMQKSSTRREQNEALIAVYTINGLKQQGKL